ncbi:hypothetical protein [Bacillus phage SBSphiJ7]|nr:hypothetical protein [Bacillus phage SBSphiJ7]
MSRAREGVNYNVVFAEYTSRSDRSSWTEYTWDLALEDDRGKTICGSFKTYYDYDSETLLGSTVRFLMGTFKTTEEDRIVEKLVIVLTNGEQITFSSSEAYKEYEALKFAYEIGEPFFELPTLPNGDSLVVNLSNVTHFFISTKGDTHA